MWTESRQRRCNTYLDIDTFGKSIQGNLFQIRSEITVFQWISIPNNGVIYMYAITEIWQ